MNSFESELGAKFPKSYKNYKNYIIKFGATHNPSLLDSIVESGSELPDLNEFAQVANVVKFNEMYWSGGMPNTVYTFATDCLGNAFCFEISSELDEVLVYDTEFDELTSLELTFDELINEYLQIVDV
ncbi:SMI1/KNR4 family protein [Aliiglaciecola litoralis]|uniref:Knr4/Smi1-like domain-containing protein n=1 Tax=Aliiglaciecola litoralis TaxID=582857 RepID=A0ABP3WSK6_9ALTE